MAKATSCLPVTMIRRQSSYFEFKISQTLVILDFVMPVLEIATYWYFIMNRT